MAPSTTLRQELQQRQGNPLMLEQAIGRLLPLCAEVERWHVEGRRCLVHASNTLLGPEGLSLRSGSEALQPQHASDQACLAPELASHQLGDRRASVFAIGALLYEMVTARTVGSDMKRPRELFPTLPQALENLLTATLITDPQHRLGDLNALARALHSLAPKGAVPDLPPARSADRALDVPLELNVSLSLLPPAKPLTVHTRVNAYGVVLQEDASAESSSASAPGSLAELKAGLEKDARPRYFATHEGMDHGPFTALELAHHVAAGNFAPECLIFDTVDERKAPIADWPPFSQFAAHARRRGERKAEAHAVAKDIQKEAKSQRKLIYGFGALLGALMLVTGVWYQSRAARQEREISLRAEEASSVETDAATVKRSRRTRRKARAASRGSVSCEAAFAGYVEDMQLGQKAGPDLTQAQLAAVVGKGQYLSGCGVPSHMKVEVCAAVQNGRAVGVTIATTPSNRRTESCIAKAVRRLRFPKHPKMDRVRTVFE